MNTKDERIGADSQPLLEESERFAPPPTRRDWLGLSAIWAAVIAWTAAAIGALRLPMPSVFPESNSRVKLGPVDQFEPGSATYFSDLSLWLFRDAEGLYAISTVCTHLGCIATRTNEGRFECPCHGSKFAPDGKVVGGPAPKGLNWLELSLASTGELVVDKIKSVSPGTRLQL